MSAGPPNPSPRPRSAKPRVLMAVLAAVIVSVMGVAAILSYRPSFYAPRPGDPDPRREQAAGRLVTRASSFYAAVGRAGRWEGAFAEEEINAWLDIDLPRNHPALLPRGVTRPHVRLAPKRMMAGACVGVGPLLAVVWADLEIVLRDVNQLAVAVEHAGLGFVPLPHGPVLRAIAARLSPLGVVCEMRRIDGRTVLVLYIPTVQNADGMNCRLEGLRIDVGEAVVEGMTRETSPAG